MSTVHIAIDGIAQSIPGGGGLKTYVRALLRHLSAQRPSGWKFHILNEPDHTKDKSTLERWWWENVRVPALVSQNQCSLLHVPAFASPRRIRCPKIVTVHDLIGILFPNQQGFLSSFYWGKWLPFAIQNSDIIIADSEHTRKDITENLRIDFSRIRVIYPGGRDDFEKPANAEEISRIRSQLGIKGNYFLFVGSCEPRKNLHRVLEAFNLFRKQNSSGPAAQLVVVGSQAFAHGRYFPEVLQSFGTDRSALITPGYTDDQTLRTLYAGAAALVFPTLYEGFGFPVLEAFQTGCPVITSRRTSIPEVGGDAVLYVDPESPTEICKVMTNLLHNDTIRTELRTKGYQQLSKFSWERAAQQIIDVYRELL